VSDGTAVATQTLQVDITAVNDTPSLAASVMSASLTDTATTDRFQSVSGSRLTLDHLLWPAMAGDGRERRGWAGTIASRRRGGRCSGRQRDYFLFERLACFHGLPPTTAGVAAGAGSSFENLFTSNCWMIVKRPFTVE